MLMSQSSAVVTPVPFLTYTHTWTGDADIQSNKYSFAETSNTLLTVADGGATDFGADDFCIEAILTISAYSSIVTNSIAGKWGVDTNQGWLLYYNSSNSTLVFDYTTDGTVDTNMSISTTLSLSTEYHVAVVRLGEDIFMFIDGVKSGTVNDISTDTIFDTTNDLTIGGARISGTASYQFGGVMDYFKISDYARYTETFTAPTSLTNDSNTIYLNSFVGADDSTPTLNTE